MAHTHTHTHTHTHIVINLTVYSHVSRSVVMLANSNVSMLICSH